jgi:hypothetical protein
MVFSDSYRQPNRLANVPSGIAEARERNKNGGAGISGRGIIPLTEQIECGIQIPTGRRDEIEVTPEMIEAGLPLLLTFSDGIDDPRKWVSDIYRAMAIAREPLDGSGRASSR